MRANTNLSIKQKLWLPKLYIFTYTVIQYINSCPSAATQTASQFSNDYNS